jgi:hypothetical protein
MDVSERSADADIAAGIEAIPVVVRGQRLPIEERQAVRIAVEAVIQAGLDDLETVREIRRRCRERKRSGLENMVAAAIDIKIFRLRRPITRQLGLDADAEYAPGRRGRTGD